MDLYKELVRKHLLEQKQNVLETIKLVEENPAMQHELRALQGMLIRLNRSLAEAG